ncbi:hypothetical protein SAZ10_02600 [Mesorhizobium sp. BAC0120]|uniref:hypothetical protein n=1 Tax=Mesorhizobium sp. BAC0120 TaxID=3090670 RepID=UPI00298D2CB0|nr:hypothetical protein [Mesorhizobium sp. BAC0120]MDW6020647.1 hypothetical protein [Mesorhizobium sp. BAC0120]
MAIIIWRRGARSIYVNRRRVMEEVYLWEFGGKSTCMSFSIPSKGGGDTIIELQIESDSFAELAAAMMKADPKAATKAFGAALQLVEGEGA